MSQDQKPRYIVLRNAEGFHWRNRADLAYLKAYLGPDAEVTEIDAKSVLVNVGGDLFRLWPGDFVRKWCPADSEAPPKPGAFQVGEFERKPVWAVPLSMQTQTQGEGMSNPLRTGDCLYKWERESDGGWVEVQAFVVDLPGRKDPCCIRVYPGRRLDEGALLDLDRVLKCGFERSRDRAYAARVDETVKRFHREWDALQDFATRAGVSELADCPLNPAE